MIRHDARYWIDALQMEPHPEGGYFKETFRSADEIQTSDLPPRFASPRSASTAIYFLLELGQFSALHRLASDEVWHFCAGTSLTVHVIDPIGEARSHRLGPNPERGEAFQVVVPARHWFGAVVNGDDEESTAPGRAFTLVGCTVAPGFCFEDFELGAREALVSRFPQHRALIERLTHPAA